MTTERKDLLLEKKQKIDDELRREGYKERDKRRKRKSVSYHFKDEAIEKLRTLHYHTRINKQFLLEHGIDLLFEYYDAKERLTPPPTEFEDWRNWDPIQPVAKRKK